MVTGSGPNAGPAGLASGGASAPGAPATATPPAAGGMPAGWVVGGLPTVTAPPAPSAGWVADDFIGASSAARSAAFLARSAADSCHLTTGSTHALSCSDSLFDAD